MSHFAVIWSARDYAALVVLGGSLLSLPACTSETGASRAEAEALADELRHLRRGASTPSAGEVTPPAEIANFCGDCHALPSPSSFVREVWYDEIQKGYEFYARSGRSDLQPPPMRSVVAFYREQAAEQLDFPTPAAVDGDWRGRFEVESVDWDDAARTSPAVSSLRWVELQPEVEHRLLVTDMRDGSIGLLRPTPGQTRLQRIARVGKPARVAPSDLDQDGRTDFVVADLGSFNPYDHAFGRVVWLSQPAGSEEYQASTLAGQLGRVADVAVADFSGDGSPDLLVAEFGHRATGSIQILTNNSQGEELRFSGNTLDIRPGSMQVVPHDWNGDGRLDFAAITSQEFECVDLFIQAEGKFNLHRVWTGRDLSVGSVGIKVVDLDRDGDQDILCVNGDCFDNNFANRSHGIQWLENRGDLGFRQHRIADLPGAYCVAAGDIDGDGDVDLIAVANLPTTVYPRTLRDQRPVSILLLEQVAPTQFTAHVLERGSPRYPAVEIADFNGDGKIDFAVGAQLFDTDPAGSEAAQLPPVAIWWQK